MSLRTRIALIGAVAALLPPLPALADCTQCSCGIQTTGLAFGAYQPQHSTDSVAVVNVTCDGDSGYAIKISSGSSGTPLVRTLHSGANVLNYNLYRDSGRSVIWGDGTSGQPGVQGSGTANYNVYGSILGNQAPSTGIYSDTLVLSIEY